MAKKMRDSESQYEIAVNEGQEIAYLFASHQEPTGDLKHIYDYYSRPDVQGAIYEFSKGRKITILREFYPMFDGLRAPEDILYIALHCVKIDRSLWPSLHGTISRVDESGDYFCDFVVEIDYKEDWRVCFDGMLPLVEQLRDFGLSFCLKYSGNCSPHLIIPGEFFPPDATRSQKIRLDLLEYIKNVIRHPEHLDLSFLSADHFLRLAYSFNENTGLVSVPILPGEYESFSRKMALPENVKVIPSWWANYPEDAQYSLESFLNQALYSTSFGVEYPPIRTALPTHYANKNLLFITKNHGIPEKQSEGIASFIRFCQEKISPQRGRYVELCRRLTLHRQKVHNAVYEFLEEFPNQESSKILLKRYNRDLNALARALVDKLPDQLSENQGQVEEQLAEINAGIASISQTDISTVKSKARNLISVSRRIQNLITEFTRLDGCISPAHNGDVAEEALAQLQPEIDRFVNEYNDCRAACGLESYQSLPTNLRQHLENWSRNTKKEAQRYLDELDLLREQAKVNRKLQLLMLLNALLATMEERLKEMAKITRELSLLKIPERFKSELTEKVQHNAEFADCEAEFYPGTIVCLNARDNVVTTVDGHFLLILNPRNEEAGLLIDVLHADVEDDRLSGVMLLKDALIRSAGSYRSLFYPEIQHLSLPDNFNLKQKITRAILDVNQGRLCRPNVMVNILLKELGEANLALISKWLELIGYEQVWRQYGEVDIRRMDIYQPDEEPKKGKEKAIGLSPLADVIDFEEILRE